MHCLTLVDFDNFFSLARSDPSRVFFQDIETVLDKFVSCLATLENQHGIQLDEITIRYYGGWYTRENEQDLRTPLCELLDQYIQTKSQRQIPNVRIRHELATEILAEPGVTFRHTHRSQPQRLNIRSHHYQTCPQDAMCSTRNAHIWMKKGCSGCTTKPEEILQRKIQKTVDTSLVCDIIYAAENIEKFNIIYLVSGDYDMVPGVLYALAKGARIVIIREREAQGSDIYLDSPNCQLVTMTM